MSKHLIHQPRPARAARKTENDRIEATQIRAGMILNIYGGTERFDVEAVKPNGYGAIIITNWRGTHRGLSENETVEILGYFNPSGVGVLA